MKYKQGDKNKVSSPVTSKLAITKQKMRTPNEAMEGPPKQRKGRSVIRLRSRSSTSDSECPTKKRRMSPSKSGGRKKSPGNQRKPPKSSKDMKTKANVMMNDKGRSSLKATKDQKEHKHDGKSPKSSNSKMKTKPSSLKKRAQKDQDPAKNHFIDLWSLATIGKREASLNATMKVNILYERQVSPKKALRTGTVAKAKQSKPQTTKLPDTSLTVKTEKSNGVVDEKNKKKVEKKAVSKKSSSQESESSKKSRKRKVSPYAIFEDEPPSKTRKGDNVSKQIKTKAKKQAKKRKSFVLRHHLGNIIERSPRQASLNAKAMIAMEQEEDIIFECAARTRIYDWTEVRPFFQNHHRRMMWMTGHGDPKYTNNRTSKGQSYEHEKDAIDKRLSAEEADGDKINGDINGNLSSNSIHNSMLKTIHEKGDPRLLKEYLRSQKEDFQGSVDIEKCPSPIPKPVEKVIVTPIPSPKKKAIAPTTHPKLDEKSTTSIKSPEKEKSPVSVISNSPAKPKPCRVATPIPEFPAEKRATHMTSFVHHPVPQSFYQTVQQSHPQPQPQPIKVTPYSPNPAYIYQYSADRQQQNLFVQSNSSPLQYGVENNDLSQRDYQPSSFSFNHMGSLSLSRRGLNPYQQGNTYSPSIHLPVQAFGYNFHHAAQYYQPSLQHLQPQQNISTLQPVSIQQYPLVQQPILSPHPLVQNLNQLQTYQTNFPQYPSNVSSQHLNQEASSCMPPPPQPPPSNPSPQKESLSQSILPSPKPIVPVSMSPTKCVNKPLKIPETSGLPLKQTNLAFLSKYTAKENPLQRAPSKEPPAHVLVNFESQSSNVKPAFPLPSKHATSIQMLPVCKKEREQEQPVVKTSVWQSPGDVSNKAMSHFKVIGEDPAVSDILRSAHSTMFPSDTPMSSEHQQHSRSVVSLPSSKSQSSRVIEGEKNVRFSVSSILDMPTFKVKTEPITPSCSKGAITILQGDQGGIRGPAQPGTFLICIPPPNVTKPVAKRPLHICPPQSTDSKSANFSPDKRMCEDPDIAQLLNNRDKVIIIDDSDSSDDEPLAKLVQSKSTKSAPSLPTPDPASSQSIAIEAKLNENTREQSKFRSTIVKDCELQKKQCKEQGTNIELFTQLHTKQFKENNVKPVRCEEPKLLKSTKQSIKTALKNPQEKLPVNACKGNLQKSDAKNVPKKTKVEKKPKLLKKSPVRRKSKTDVGNPPLSSAVHGWSWLGEGEWRSIPKLSQQKEEPLRKRLCYKSMKHISGEVISVRDCVILQSDGDGSVPYVAKVSALWENQTGDMMFSMLWYYQPEHTSMGRESEDGEQELFASKHREENSVACIDDKCYVLMYIEYCRMEAEAVRLAQGLPLPRWHELIPTLSDEDKKLCRPMPGPNVCLDNIWFCRYDYDIRKKIVRKPKHKKTDLRYRGPCKLV